MTDFKREDRYVVIKRTDIERYLSDSEVYKLEKLAEAVARRRLLFSNRPPLQCVVVESDWPEYETVWQMIERRVTDEAASKS